MSGQARRRAVRAPQAKSASDHFLTEALRTLDPRLNTARVQSARVLDVPLTYQDGQLVSCEPRYFLSSLAPEALSLAHWLLVVRRHWGVENDCHKTFDMAFDEDDHPWIEMDPQGALVVLLLRRLAYNLLTLFRSVTQRSDERRGIAWKYLMGWVYLTLVAATDVQLDGIRKRKVAGAFA